MNLKKIFKKILIFFNLRINCWVLFYGEGNSISNISFRNTQIINPPRGKFWADPFLVNKGEKKYIFFEEYSYNKEKGVIKCGELSNKSLINVRTVLSGDHHLSYPCINKIDEKYYLIPECSESNELYIYKSVEFPYLWEKHVKLFNNKRVADPTIFQDKNDQIWLFVNILNEENNYNSKLNIYKLENNFLNIIPHKKNPVIDNYSNARGAGNVFYSESGDLLRPSQNNSSNVYGGSLNISKIEILDINNYKEILLKNLKPNFKFGLKGVHHYTKDGKNFLIDGLYPIKIL
jgi:hypothetical protein